MAYSRSAAFAVAADLVDVVPDPVLPVREPAPSDRSSVVARLRQRTSELEEVHLRQRSAEQEALCLLHRISELDSRIEDSPHPESPSSRAGERTPSPPAAAPAASQSSGSSRLWTSGFPSLQVSPWLASAAEGRLRAYAVWVLPGHPELRGVHLGGAQAWLGLQDRLPGRSYSFQSGARLRAFPTPALAIIGYLQEAEARGAPDLVLFRWYEARHH